MHQSGHWAHHWYWAHHHHPCSIARLVVALHHLLTSQWAGPASYQQQYLLGPRAFQIEALKLREAPKHAEVESTRAAPALLLLNNSSMNPASAILLQLHDPAALKHDDATSNAQVMCSNLLPKTHDEATRQHAAGSCTSCFERHSKRRPGQPPAGSCWWQPYGHSKVYPQAKGRLQHTQQLMGPVPSQHSSSILLL